MSMHEIALALALIATPAIAADNPHFGVPASPKDIAAWDISIGPDGSNLPPGKGTVAAGAKLFQERCAACHGEKGEGKPSDRLVGGIGSLTGEQPVRTVGSYWPYATTLFDYVRRAMPLTEPQSLTNDEVYALSAFILNLNGIIRPKDVMNAKTLPKVKMPNHDAFFIVYPGKVN